MKKRTIILAGAAAFALAASALTAAFFYIPGDRPAFEEGDLHICLNEDGTINLDWPEAALPLPAGSEDSSQNEAEEPAENSDSEQIIHYDLDIKSGNRHIKQMQSYTGILLEDCTFPMTVRIRALTSGKNLLGMFRAVSSTKSLEASVEDQRLPAPEATGTPGPGNLALSWKSSGSPELYEIFTLNDSGMAYVASTSSQKIDLSVGREADLSMPTYGQPLKVQVRAGVQGSGYVLCGPASNLISVERQDLLGDDLNLIYLEPEPLHYTLEWDETRGDYYEFQEWSEDGWTLLQTLEPAERFTLELGRLVSGSRHRYQVVAKDSNDTVRSSEEVEFFASTDPLYATIWPIIDQPFYQQASQDSASLGKIPGGTTLCVLEEQGDWFQVRYKDQYGYVDSRFCMINLPEYVGDHCEYDITNSYKSVFKVHDSPIALITDQVISGFEHIQEADGQFLVPYLYPCAKKLLTASLQAEADGYRMKIYEAFRPNQATRFLYDTTSAQLNWAALVYENSNAVDPVTGWVVDLADGLLTDPETRQKISREALAQREAEAKAEEEAKAKAEAEAKAAEEAAKAQAEAAKQFLESQNPEIQLETPIPEGEELPLPESAEPEAVQPAEQPDFPQSFVTLPEEDDQDEGGLQPVEPPAEPQPEPSGNGEEGETEPLPQYDTYFKIMTNGGRFNLGSFLARVTSAHNRGIALDMTLARIDSGEELAMQSAIHDLSWYSATYLNNDNAKLLEKYMTGVGMRGLTSEWWHFQDDETRESIGLSSYLYKGVDMGGWTRDERGWRYRNPDGSILKSTSQTIDGKRYSFDPDGYTAD